jgi:4-diphosphocytidyl-2-C-methyl-D-erythritol kinase
VSSPQLRVEAPAKVNLVLELMGLLPDGYTEIQTIFQTLDLADTLELSVLGAGEGITLDVDRELDCAPEDNLVWRAARAFLDRAGLDKGLAIRLEKRVPHGAGLGGGSSDAAAMLRALEDLFPRALSPAEVEAIAASLGADVPYFLEGGLALGTGRGDQLQLLPELSPLWLVLVRKGDPLGTAEVYRKAREGLTRRDVAPNIRRFFCHLREAGDAAPPVWNDLQAAAVELQPAIGELIEDLAGLGGQAVMTGSGSAVFAIFPDERGARMAAGDIERRWPEAWVVVTRTRPGRTPRTALPT